MPLSVFLGIGKTRKNLRQVLLTIIGFKGDYVQVEGLGVLKQGVRSRATHHGVHVVEGEPSYNALLHYNYVVPSSLHQSL